jgi:hypothetical protein
MTRKKKGRPAWAVFLFDLDLGIEMSFFGSSMQV